MKIIGTLLLLCVALFACTEEFEEINTNPNGPVMVQPELLFRQVLYGYGNDMGREGFTGGALLSQHFAMTDFNLFDRHELSSPQEGGDPWPILYTALRDNETLLDVSRTNPAAAVYEGPALVMKAYLAMQLTDLFGDVPYAEAFNARRGQVTNPVYDDQESIYNGQNGILENLLAARIAMDNYRGATPLNGDIVYNGNLPAWIRLANSLLIKATMRTSSRRSDFAGLRELFSGDRFIQSADQDAVFQFAASPPNSFPIAEVRQGIFDVFLMSRTAGAIFSELNDDRVDVLYRSNQADGGFAGIQNGTVGGLAVPADTFARPGLVWRENTERLRFNFMTAWETDLWLAEAALRGFIEADAASYYRSGVEKAFAYWGTEVPATYLEDGPAAFSDDPEVALEQIITQKWIAGAGNAYEGWTEWRRTGYPTLQPVAASLNGGELPTRMPYPGEEQALNFENYTTAASATDGNSINARVWWDQ